VEQEKGLYFSRIAKSHGYNIGRVYWSTGRFLCRLQTNSLTAFQPILISRIRTQLSFGLCSVYILTNSEVTVFILAFICSISHFCLACVMLVYKWLRCFLFSERSQHVRLFFKEAFQFWSGYSDYFPFMILDFLVIHLFV